jgi:Ala-tRNA(Pro) deacylase
VSAAARAPFAGQGHGPCGVRFGRTLQRAGPHDRAAPRRTDALHMEAIMSIPARLSSYLDERGVRYEVCPHEHSHSSAETARSAHVASHQLAKSVILEHDGGRMMAIVPADRSVMLGELSRLVDRRDLRLADEDAIAEMFSDCDRGAVPSLGMAWGVETIVDDELASGEVVYLEAGDHENLLRLSTDQFRALTQSARHGHFSREPIH